MSTAFLKSSAPSRALSLHISLSAGLFLIAFIALQHLSQIQRPISPLQTPLRDFPPQVGAWKGTEGELGADVAAVLGLDDWLLRQYRNESGAAVWFYIGYLGQWDAAKRRQAPHSPQFCYPAQGWEPRQRAIQEIAVPGGQRILVNKLVVQKGLERSVVLYWFQWGERIAAEEYGYDLRAKLSWLIQLPSRLARSGRTDRTLVQISAPVAGEVEETLACEVAFIQAVFPLLVERFSLEVSSR